MSRLVNQKPRERPATPRSPQRALLDIIERLVNHHYAILIGIIKRGRLKVLLNYSYISDGYETNRSAYVNSYD